MPSQRSRTAQFNAAYYLFRSFMTASLAVALLIGAGTFVFAQSSSERAAARQVEALLNSAQSAVNRGGSESSKVSAVRSVVRRHFAVGTWANALIGRQASQFSNSQRSEFRNLLPSYLAKLYVNQFGGGGPSDYSITDTRTVRGDVLVSSRIARSGGRTIPVVWRLRTIGGRPRVIDYSVGGVSNVVLKRSEFSSKVRQAGASGLNDFLKQFIAS